MASDGTPAALWNLSPVQDEMIRSSCFGPVASVPYELVHHAFEERAVRKPDLVAVEYEDKSITYGEMNHQATVLASRLVSLGVGVGSRVAVLMERCLEFPIGLLAVLKAGGSMMPLDASFPVNRLSFMLSDASASVVVTTEEYRGQVESLELAIPVVYFSSSELALESVVPSILNEATRHDEAYVVYTSGSTGRPKGVPVLHGGAVNCIEVCEFDYLITEGSRVLQFGSTVSDVFHWELWKAVSRGATLVLRSESIFDALSTVDAITCTATGLSLIGSPVQYPMLKFVAVGGEALPASIKDLWSQHVVLTNCYGPSECAIQTHECKMDPDAPVTIGHPMQNVNSYILDENMRPVPVGVVGEIYLGGICVSPGYINLPDQTAERFVDDPFVSGGGRMFRTGDYGRLLPNGHFEVHGRKDSQVKLKGYRIELEEIGEAMMRHPQVTAAAAIVKDHTHLVGFFTPANVDVDELRELVASHLPVYMVPAVWMGLESMPQNVSGKTDRLALEAMNVVVQVESLQTEAEKRMAEVWAQVLAVDISQIGPSTSFFSLGGDSISAIRLVAKAKHVGFKLTSALVMKKASLASMVRVAKHEEVVLAVISDDIHGEVPLTPIQYAMFEHPWKNINYWNLSMTLKPRNSLDQAKLEDAVSALIEHHDVLRTRFYHDMDKGWHQMILPKANSGPLNVRFVHVDFDDLRSAILDVEQSLSLTDGPIYAVTVFLTPENEQYLQFTAHHAVMDLVSWRILVDDLESLLCGKQLDAKSMSFKAWSELLTAKALDWDGSAWDEYMCDDVEPPSHSSPPTHTIRSSAVLDESTTNKLDLANTKYGTNVQEVALAALTEALAELRSNRSGSKFAVMLESHGREPWAGDIDITSTVGWFTCEYPVMFTPTSEIGDMLLQVKQKLRSVPHKGLSYGAIKYLVPLSESTKKIKTHRHHNISFNYTGRFQEINAEEGYFKIANDISVPQFADDEAPLSPGNLLLSHESGQLVLMAAMADWQFSSSELETWMDLWITWMHRIVDHCLDPSTIGGRTLYDLPLLGSMSVVKDVETELLETLHLRPSDVEDIYPVTPLQSGFLWAMLQDPSEYVLQSAIDIRGDFDFVRFKSCWQELTLQTDILRTVFVSTTHGIFQAVTKDDLTECQMLDEVWSFETLEENSESYFSLDRQRGFSLASRSFQRFCGVRVSDGRLRIFWTSHHSVSDGWSSPILLSNFMSLCYGEKLQTQHVPFKNHIEWMVAQDTETSKLFWRDTMRHVDETAPLLLPKPMDLSKSSAKYSTFRNVVHLPQKREVCKSLGTTPSTVFRAAWALVLQQYTRREYVKFGSVVSGRDSDVEGIDRMIGATINTIPILVHVPPTSDVAQIISSVHDYSVNLVHHGHCSILDIKAWADVKTSHDLFETIMVYENYPSVDSPQSNPAHFPWIS
ncbi:hypothetical protein AC1031_014655 [Aphanomyces cochlioides]|nr:hypothetical protein AC1031_014655 [Aphanomyces cochlioides]